MLRAEFEPATPATKRPQTYVLDFAATGIGTVNDSKAQKLSSLFSFYRLVNLATSTSKLTSEIVDL
jgi:hypothetical protein